MCFFYIQAENSKNDNFQMELVVKGKIDVQDNNTTYRKPQTKAKVVNDALSAPLLEHSP